MKTESAHMGPSVYGLAPWRIPLTPEHEIRLNGTAKVKEKRVERKAAKRAIRLRLRGRLIHHTYPGAPQWHGYDAWLESQGVRK